jgi:REP element-mobilizing transposase RayT
MEISEPEKFKGKYRIDSARLKYWDYSADGGYFITIVTKDRECFFGEIENDQMKLSEMGKSAQDCWHEIPKHFPFVILDEFVVMPNHIHGVLFIEKPTAPVPAPVETQDLASLPLPTRNPPPPPFTPNKFGPQSKNLASIIRGYKIGVTKFANHHQIPFTWQPRYHDRIIRSESELNRISEYISNNPAQWETDRNNESK